MLLVGLFVVLLIVVIYVWRKSRDESFIMRYVPMSDSFYYAPPWGPVPMMWGRRRIPMRLVAYDGRRPFHMRYW